MIKEKIISLRESPSELSTYLFSLYESNYNVKEDEFLMKELEDYLFNKDNWLLKKVALYGLLGHSKVNKKEYIERALSLLNNLDEDEEVRIWAITGLIAVSDKTKILLVDSLKNIGFNKSEDEFIRYTAIVGLLNLNGVPLFKLNLRDDYMPPYEEDFTIEGFLKCVKEDIEKYNLYPKSV